MRSPSTSYTWARMAATPSASMPLRSASASMVGDRDVDVARLRREHQTDLLAGHTQPSRTTSVGGLSSRRPR